MKVIINADDLGISPEVNDAIFDLMRAGKINSATILANGPAVEDAAKRALEFPNCSFGVHLNITEFEPLSGSANLHEALTQEGTFQPDGFIRKGTASPTLIRGIGEEWTAQVQRVKDLGVPISHLDSHHHMHTHPPLMAPLGLVQRKFGIRKVRISQNLYTSAELGGRRLHGLKKWLWKAVLKVRTGAITTDRFTKFSTLMEIGPSLIPNFRSLELMVHPGHGFPEFQQEIVDLNTDWQSRLQFPVKLVSFNNL